MQKVTVSYGEYGRLCEAMSRLSLKASRLPTDEEIGILTSEMAGYFLGLTVWLVEKDGCMPRRKGLPGTIEKLNDRLDEAMADFMESKDGAETAGWENIEYTDYEKLYGEVEKIGFISEGVFPSKKEILELFRPNMKFCLGFVMLLLFKNPDMKGKEEYGLLRKSAADYFILRKGEKEVCMNRAEYYDLVDTFGSIRIDREGWWPTMEDVNNKIRPNFALCFDFVLWLLNSEEKPKKDEEKEACRALKEMVRENTEISTGRDIPWL